jgi:hypothetical protein
MSNSQGNPEASEFATMGNYIMDGKTFEDAVKDEGIPDNPVYRKSWDTLKKEIEGIVAAGGTPDFDHD